MQTIKKQQVNSLLPKAKHPFRSSHEAPFHHASQFCFRSLFTRLLTTKIIRLQTKYLERPIGQRRGSRTFLGSIPQTYCPALRTWPRESFCPRSLRPTVSRAPPGFIFLPQRSFFNWRIPARSTFRRQFLERHVIHFPLKKPSYRHF